MGLTQLAPIILVSLVFFALQTARVFSEALAERDRTLWQAILLAYGLHLGLVWITFSMALSGYPGMGILAGAFLLLALGVGAGLFIGAAIAVLRGLGRS